MSSAPGVTGYFGDGPRAVGHVLAAVARRDERGHVLAADPGLFQRRVEGPAGMLHEVRDKTGFARDLHAALKPGARFLVPEPVFHVNRNELAAESATIAAVGFELLPPPRVAFSHVALFERI